MAGPQAESIDFQGRMETIYGFGKPFADTRKPMVILDPKTPPCQVVSWESRRAMYGKPLSVLTGRPGSGP